MEDQFVEDMPPPPYTETDTPDRLYQECQHMMEAMQLQPQLRDVRDQCNGLRDINVDVNVQMNFKCQNCLSQINESRVIQIRPHDDLSCNQVNLPPLDRCKCGLNIHTHFRDNGPLTVNDLCSDNRDFFEPEADYDRTCQLPRTKFTESDRYWTMDADHKNRREWLNWRTEINRQLLTISKTGKKDMMHVMLQKDQPISHTAVTYAVDRAYMRPRGLPMSSLPWRQHIVYGIPRAHLKAPL